MGSKVWTLKAFCPVARGYYYNHYDDLEILEVMVLEEFILEMT